MPLCGLQSHRGSFQKNANDSNPITREHNEPKVIHLCCMAVKFEKLGHVVALMYALFFNTVIEANRNVISLIGITFFQY